jgi:hypothetical protein
MRANYREQAEATTRSGVHIRKPVHKKRAAPAGRDLFHAEYFLVNGL